MFEDNLIHLCGLEYKAKLPCGYIVYYISEDTAKAYKEFRGAKVSQMNKNRWEDKA